MQVDATTTGPQDTHTRMDKTLTAHQMVHSPARLWLKRMAEPIAHRPADDPRTLRALSRPLGTPARKPETHMHFPLCEPAR